MSSHTVTCRDPPCPYHDDHEGVCRRARPAGFQPNLRAREYWSIWPSVRGETDWCGEHPALRWVVREIHSLHEQIGDEE